MGGRPVGAVGAGPAVVVVDDGFAGGDQGVVGDDLVAIEDLHPSVMGEYLHRLSDQLDRDRVAG